MSENSYSANQIKVLSGLSAVRKRPAMYIGNTAIEGLHHLVYEVVDNSIDEALAGYCTRIKIVVRENGSVVVEDNGRGIPVDMHPTEKVPALELVMTRLHAGGKFDHQTYKVSGGLHGVGVSVVNALSEYLDVEVYRDGKIYHQHYERGIASGEMECLGETDKRGTRIEFKPDAEIFRETTEFQFDILQARMRELAFLNPSISIELEDEKSGKSRKYHFSGGIVSFVEYLNQNKDVVNTRPIYISGEKNQVQVEVAIQYNRGYSEKILSYVNNIRTKEGGSHVTGFRQALTKCINRYATDDIVPKKLRAKLGGDDVREGLTAVISTRVPNPQFEGQTKTKLGNSEVRSVVSSIVHEALSTYLEENPQEARKILAKAVDAARAREAARKAKELTRKKGSSSDILMAGKLAECQEKDASRREIYIVEGDSAGGSAKQGRDRSNQAILPLRGKIMNVEKARFDKMLSSEEIRNLIAALGTGIGSDDFDASKVRYHKIIIMTDADVDGAHIRTLLLTFFYRQMPELVESGFLYVAQPPLYRVAWGKNRELFIKDDESLDKFLFERAIKDRQLRPAGWDKNISGARLLETLSKISMFQESLTAIEKKGFWRDLVNALLENQVARETDFLDYEYVKNLAEKMSEQGFKVGRVKSCQGENNGYEFSAGIKDLAYLTAKVGPNIVNLPEYKRIVKIYSRISEFEKNEVDILHNGESVKKCSNSGEIIEYFRTAGRKGINIQRYKGLGEMNPEQLWETTMNPEKRTLLQVSIRDADEAELLFTTLMGEKIEPRREFIYKHALEAGELDI